MLLGRTMKKHTSRPKGRAHCAQSCVGVKQAAEKPGISCETVGKRPSGAEAPTDSAGLMRGLKHPPPSVLRFSAACKTPTYQSRPTARTSFSAACLAGMRLTAALPWGSSAPGRWGRCPLRGDGGGGFVQLFDDVGGP